MLTKVKGLEPSQAGSHHWRYQRVSALVLIPLTLWFMFAFVNRIGDNHQALSTWIGQPSIAVLLVLYLGCMCFHAQLGVQVVVEDYIHSQGRKKFSLLLNKIVFLVAGVLATVSVMLIWL